MTTQSGLPCMLVRRHFARHFEAEQRCRAWERRCRGDMLVTAATSVTMAHPVIATPRGHADLAAHAVVATEARALPPAAGRCERRCGDVRMLAAATGCNDRDRGNDSCTRRDCHVADTARTAGGASTRTHGCRRFSFFFMHARARVPSARPCAGCCSRPRSTRSAHFQRRNT